MTDLPEDYRRDLEQSEETRRRYQEVDDAA